MPCKPFAVFASARFMDEFCDKNELGDKRKLFGIG